MGIYALIQEEKDLRVLQEQKWGPVLEWFEKRFGIKQEISHDLEPPPVSIKTREALARHFLSYDFAALNGLFIFLIERITAYMYYNHKRCIKMF